MAFLVKSELFFFVVVADANDGQGFGSTVMAAIIGIVVPVGKHDST